MANGGVFSQKQQAALGEVGRAIEESINNFGLSAIDMIGVLEWHKGCMLHNASAFLHAQAQKKVQAGPKIAVPGAMDSIRLRGNGERR